MALLLLASQHCVCITELLPVCAITELLSVHTGSVAAAVLLLSAVSLYTEFAFDNHNHYKSLF